MKYFIFIFILLIHSACTTTKQDCRDVPKFLFDAKDIPWTICAQFESNVVAFSLPQQYKPFTINTKTLLERYILSDTIRKENFSLKHYETLINIDFNAYRLEVIYLPNHEHGTITWIKEKENTLYTRLFIYNYDLGALSEPDIIIIQIPAHAPPLKIVECRSERPKKKGPPFPP